MTSLWTFLCISFTFFVFYMQSFFFLKPLSSNCMYYILRSNIYLLTMREVWGKDSSVWGYPQNKWSPSSQSFSYHLYISIHKSLSLLCSFTELLSRISPGLCGYVSNVHAMTSLNSACPDLGHYLPHQAHFPTYFSRGHSCSFLRGHLWHQVFDFLFLWCRSLCLSPFLFVVPIIQLPRSLYLD